MNILGLISTGLELVGLSLAFLDMRLPTQMKVLEDVIDNAGDRLLEYTLKNKDEIWYQVVLSISILFIFIVGFGWMFGSTFPLWCYVGFWLSSGGAASLIIIALLGDFIALLNRFSVYDQAVTTLGFFLATSGMIIELLQLFGFV